MIILGIDPGTHFTGFGVIQLEKKHPSHVDCGLIAPNRNTTLPLKLKKIFDEISGLILKFSPQEIALEDVFMAKNARSSLKLGYVRGVVMLAAAQAGIGLYEYPPATVKKAISDFGQATKEQMQKMIRIHLKLKEPPAEDATDALAVALTHCSLRKFL